MAEKAKVRFRDLLGKPRDQWTPPEKEHAQALAGGGIILVILFGIGSCMTGGDEEATASADQATQAEVDTWVEDVEKDALLAYGVDSWDEWCDDQTDIMMGDLATTGESSTTGWSCFKPEFSATTIGDLDMHLDTYNEETVDAAAEALMTMVGYSRPDLEAVNVYDSGGGLLGYKLRHQVPALELQDERNGQ